MKKIFGIVLVLNIIILVMMLFQSCTESNVFPYIPDKESKSTEYSSFPHKVGTQWVYEVKYYEGLYGNMIASDTERIEIVSSNYLLPDSGYYLKCDVGKWNQSYNSYDFITKIYYLLKKDSIQKSNMDMYAPFSSKWYSVKLLAFPISVHSGWNPGTWSYMDPDSGYPIESFKDTAYVENITTIKINNEWIDAFRIIRQDLFQDVREVYLYHPKYGIVADSLFTNGVKTGDMFLINFIQK